MLPDMSESATNPIEPPPKTAEELAEIRAVLEQVRRGDYSGTIPVVLVDLVWLRAAPGPSELAVLG